MNSAKVLDKGTDPEIIERIIAGEKNLFEVLIRRYNPALYKVGRSYGYNHHDVEDLMQETYVNAYKALKDFKQLSGFKTWLTRIMLNLCYHKKQKHSYTKEILFSNDNNNTMVYPSSNNTGKSVVNKELGTIIENALQNLPHDYRLIFALRELNGMSVAETAEVTNNSEANVKTRLSRAKALLRTEIEKMYQVEDIYEFNLVYCDRIVERVMSEI